MDQVTAAIIAFAAGVIVTALGGWSSQRIERRKHLAQLASAAFIDAVEAMAEHVQCKIALAGEHLSDDERGHWRRRVHETGATYFAAKARFVTYGNSEAGILLADFERQPSIDDPRVPQIAAKLVLSLREELGFKRRDIPETEIASILFGPSVLDDRQDAPDYEPQSS
jgi:hypothetical protein